MRADSISLIHHAFTNPRLYFSVARMVTAISIFFIHMKKKLPKDIIPFNVCTRPKHLGSPVWLRS